MLSLELLILAGLATTSLASPHEHAHAHFKRSQLHARNYVTPAQRSESYDFVIAGGGLAGLVLAARLSDDSTKTVLVLEAGPSGDDVPTKINVPGETYYNSLLGAAPYDWTYTTVPQPNANGRTMAQPRGRVLGGSSAVNGMYIVRPPDQEINAWHDLIAEDGKDTAAPWAWDAFLGALKKIETFTPPGADPQAVAGIKFDQSSRGTSGPLKVSYPAYMVPMTKNWLPTLEAAGIPTQSDGYSGNNIGAFFATSSINPSNLTRSYSKSAFIDSLPPRSNLHIIPGATVTRIVFSDNVQGGNMVADAVEFSMAKGGEVLSVGVGKEVILAGGAMGSPQMLMVSGVGPKDVLEGAGVAVKVELPGVGQHLQDHMAAGVFWETSEDTQGTIRATGSTFSQSKEFNSFINSGIAYINATHLFPATSPSAFLSSLTPPPLSTLVPSTSPEVLAGYTAITQATSGKIYPEGGLVELLLSINAPGQVAVQAALQQPLSHGRVYIGSKDVFDNIVVDPGYFSHPADLVVLREGLKLARTIGQTAPLSTILGTELTPGLGIQSDEDWDTWIRNVAGTEFHPTGTSAMLPKAKGGVVDAKLKVYGLANVRVADSSVFPVSFSAHLMAPTYALAEQAASIILATYNPTSPTTTGGSGSGAGTGTGAPGTTATGAAGRSFAASSVGMLGAIGALLLLV
ncbi:mala s 12 allergen [Crassisporium funariophilum]|nr:mala s 12 allergen [Crassisporium funariophilum]